MKYKLIPLLLLLMLASCTITKRRYMPGYSLNWNHKTSKSIASCNPQIVHISNQGFHASPPAPIEHGIPLFSEKNISPHKHSQQSHYNNTATISPVTVIETKKFNITPTALQPSIPDHGLNNQKVVCKEAKTSLRFGILTWTVPAALIFLGFLIGYANSDGGLNSFAYLIVIPFVGLGALFALISLIITLTSGATALTKIKKYPDQYTGKWKAIIGILLVTVPIVAIILTSIILG